MTVKELKELVDGKRHVSGPYRCDTSQFSDDWMFYPLKDHTYNDRPAGGLREVYSLDLRGNVRRSK